MTNGSINHRDRNLTMADHAVFPAPRIFSAISSIIDEKFYSLCKSLTAMLHSRTLFKCICHVFLARENTYYEVQVIQLGYYKLQIIQLRQAEVLRAKLFIMMSII